MPKLEKAETIEKRRRNIEKVQKWRRRHPAKQKELSRQYWLKIKNDPKKLEERKKYARQYYKNHRKERIKSVQEFWERNPEKKFYYRKRSSIKNRRRILKLRFLVFLRDDFTCQHCGRSAPEVEIEVDHKIPVSVSKKKRDYQDISVNINDYITACKECNIGKGDIILKMFETHT